MIKSSTAAITFARMNPPTIGHERLIQEMHANFWQGHSWVFLSPSHDNKRNPLSHDYRCKLVRSMIGFRLPLVSVSKIPNYMEAIKQTEEMGYTHLHIITGSDRVERLEEIAKTYNGREFYFKSIEIHKINRDEGSLESGISSTKMRQYAIDGDLDRFREGLPILLKEDAEEIYGEIRKCLSASKSLTN